MRKVLKAPLSAIAIIGLSSLSANAGGNDQSHESRPDKHVAAREVMVHATVKTIDVERRTMKISHGPVKEFDWPATTTDVKVADDIDLDVLHHGQEIMVALVRRDGDIYVITKFMIHDH